MKGAILTNDGKAVRVSEVGEFPAGEARKGGRMPRDVRMGFIQPGVRVERDVESDDVEEGERAVFEAGVDWWVCC